MPIPKYFINERMTALKEREKMLGQILAKLGPQDEEGVGKIRYFIILSVAFCPPAFRTDGMLSE